MTWLGKFLRNREVAILKHLADIPQVPKVLALYEKTGFLYQYIEGHTLDELQNLPDDFFENLKNLLQQIHKKNIVYIDMNKRSNIIQTTNRQPNLIDFQISMHIKPRLPILRYITQSIKEELIKSDFYHLYKHKRRLSPQHLSPDEKSLSNPRLAIKLHRIIATPYRKIRRAILNSNP